MTKTVSFGRPNSYAGMPSLVGDRGRVMGWALTRIPYLFK